MKRAIITVLTDKHNVIYARELKPDCIYTISFVDEDWVMHVQEGEHPE